MNIKRKSSCPIARDNPAHSDLWYLAGTEGYILSQSLRLLDRLEFAVMAMLDPGTRLTLALSLMPYMQTAQFHLSLHQLE